MLLMFYQILVQQLVFISCHQKFLFELKENNENDMTFCYLNCFGWYCFQPTSVAALSFSALTRWSNTIPLDCPFHIEIGLQTTKYFFFSLLPFDWDCLNRN